MAKAIDNPTSQGVSVTSKRKSPVLLKRVIPRVKAHKDANNGALPTFLEIDAMFPEVFPREYTRNTRKHRKGEKFADGESASQKWFYSLIQRAETEAGKDKYRALYDAIAEASGLGAGASAKMSADDLADQMADEFDDLLG